MDEELFEMSVQDLMAKKDSIEAEIKAQRDLLEEQRGVGMKGPLVDAEGFPRADIDVYSVRTARNKVICLQNDHKEVMKVIEQKLHEIHADARKRRALGSDGSSAAEMKKEVPRGFARINAVSDGSPAALAGLQFGDELVEFGSVSTRNFSGLENIASVVKHSQGRPVRVSVIRKGVIVTLSLVPQKWAGKGLLGCAIAAL